MTKEFVTKHYYVGIDKARNLIVIKPIGFWPSIDTVPKYKSTVLDVIDNLLDKDFRVIFDMSEMKAHPNKVRDEIHLKGVIEILKRKPGAAVIVSPASSIVRMQTDFLRKNSKEVHTKHFDTLAEALNFMDHLKS